MNLRRLPMLVVVVACLAAVVYYGRTTPPALQPLFAEFDAPGMPALPANAGLTETWFCPGVPGAAVEGAADQGGSVVVSNDGTAPVAAVVTTLSVDQPPAEQTVEIAAGTRQSIDVAAGSASAYVAATVEITGGEAIVEQTAVHPEGSLTSPCSASTARQWYFADGFTVDDSTEQLVITNPYDQTAVVDLSFVTDTDSRTPSALQGYPVPPGSVRVIDVAANGMTDEPIVGVSAIVTAGQVVMGKAQVYAGEGRRGYSMALGSPQLRDQWWFAYAERGEGWAEEYRLYNPSDDPIQVTPVFLGLDPEAAPVLPDPIEVPAGEVVAFVVDDTFQIPEGAHAMVFGTNTPDDAIVVEQVLTRTVDNRATTSVVLGATSRPSDAYIASTWYVGAGVAEPTETALAIYNPDQSPGTITVSVATAEGPTPVAALSEIPIAGSSVITLDLTDPAVVDKEIMVTSSGRIFVSRILRREGGSEGRVISWAVPAGA